MSEKMSTGFCNALLDTADFKTQFTSGFLRIFDGSPPATADAAETGTLLCIVSVNSTGTGVTWAAAGADTPGVIGKTVAEVWSGLILATSTATYFRLVAVGDDGTNADDQARIQGTIGTGGADMNIGTTALTNGATFTISYATQAFVPG